MTNNRYAMACAEASEILKYLSDELKANISENFLKTIEKNKDKNHTFIFDTSKTIDNQEILEETKAILTIVYRNFLCTEEEKENLNKKLRENEHNRQLELENKRRTSII